MAGKPVHATVDGVPPRLRDYEAARREFSWGRARAELAGLPGGGVNIAYEAVDRHVAEGRGDAPTLRLLDRQERRTDLTYRELQLLTNRFANLLRHLDVGPGDRVFSLLPRGPALYVTALGTLRNGSVFSPLFPAFGPDPVRQRLELGEARALVTTPQAYRRKIHRSSTGSPTCVRWSSPGRTHRSARCRWSTGCGRSRLSSTWRAPDPRTSPCCTSPAGPQACRRAPCTCTRPWSRTGPRPRPSSTSGRATSSGARRTPAGSPARVRDRRPARVGRHHGRRRG